MPSSTSSSQSIPLPHSLSSTTPTLPTSTQEALISHLRQTNSIPDLSSLLADSLARTGWTDRVRALSLELLRNGTCDTFPELMAEVLRRAKIPKSPSTGTASQNVNTSMASTSSSGPTSAPGSSAGAGTANGVAANGGMNGTNAITVSKEWSGGPDGLPDVRIPEVTVEAGVEFLKERIKDVVEVVDEEDDD
jgi:hypothetical protein